MHMPIFDRVTQELMDSGESSLVYNNRSYDMGLEDKADFQLLTASRADIELGYIGIQSNVQIQCPYCPESILGSKVVLTQPKENYLQLGPIWKNLETLDFHLFWIFTTLAVSISRKNVNANQYERSVVQFPNVEISDSFQKKYSSCGFTIVESDDVARVFWTRDMLPFTSSSRFQASDNVHAYNQIRKPF